MASEPVRLSDEDRALLERVAERVVALRMEVPAILALETGRPLSVLAGQTLHFFEPMVTALLPIRDYRRFATLVERRETLDVLLERIEELADVAHRERRAAAKARREARRSRP
jgi:hypothetical protein